MACACRKERHQRALKPAVRAWLWGRSEEMAAGRTLARVSKCAHLLALPATAQPGTGKGARGTCASCTAHLLGTEELHHTPCSVRPPRAGLCWTCLLLHECSWMQVRIGKSGLTRAFLCAVGDQLQAHELVRVRGIEVPGMMMDDEFC